MTNHDLEHELATFIPSQRWFRTKSERVESTRVVARFELPGTVASLCIVEVRLAGGRTDTYALATSGKDLDALAQPPVLRALLAAMSRGDVLTDGPSSLRFHPLAGIPADVVEGVAPKLLKAEQTNSSVLYGQFYVGKIIRKLDAGASPDLDMGRFLTRAGYASTPALVGYAELERPGAEPSTIALLHAFVANEGDAWTHALAAVGEALDGNADIDSYGALATKLGQRVGEMHAALASRSDDPDFAPEPLGRAGVEVLVARAREDLTRGLAADTSGLPAVAREALDAVRAARTTLAARLGDAIVDEAGPRMRVHGDLHLGQVLFTGDDFVILDFEGEPARTLAERKAKRPPLVDVAGMLRSYDYAAAVASRERDPSLASRAHAWRDAASSAFMRGYLEGVGDAPVLPPGRAARDALLDVLLLEKCLYELRYELDNRPDWVAIPATGLRQIAGGARHG